MAGVKAPPIITCPEWGARQPAHRPTLTGRPVRLLFHHTAGHHSEISNPADESRDELIRYARVLQADMMDRRGWSDSGHNFLVGRNGLIVQGRWGTVTAIEHGRMVVSAHCPGQNDQPGIEHEHTGTEAMTDPQLEASVWLQAWICDRTGIRPTEIYGHRHFYGTDCPGHLNDAIPQVRRLVARELQRRGRGRPGTPGLLLRARFAGSSHVMV